LPPPELCDDRPVQRVNIASTAFETDPDDPPGFRAGLLRLGPRLGATRTGMSIYDVPPGERICPYHYEHAEEEWLLVLAGRPTVRHPAGADRLEPWDVVFFPRGPDGAHAVHNDTDEPVRVLMASDRYHPAATVYPDSGKIAIWTGNPADDVIVRRASAVDYYDGELPPGPSGGVPAP
jgi:uncharacterized cupin superfamily protein